MELQLIDGSDISLDSNAEFELPSYVVRLDPNLISRDSDPESTIIASGFDPSDGKITIVTMNGKILVFDARKFYIPDGPAVPYNGGKELFLENIDGRWPGESDGFYVDSSWVIEKSVSGLTGAILKINYLNEDNNT